jgi:hypothetical protein
VALGALAGVADWVIEAMTRYGGLAARIHAAQAENGGGGLHFAGAAQLRALAGPALCRGSCHVSAATVYRLWWLVLTGLVVVGVVQARRHRRLALALLPLTVGLALAAQYVFTVTYAAPRFLLPTYALLSLPAASGVLAILRRAPAGRARVVVATALAGVLVVHTVLQVHVLTAFIAPGARVTAAEIHADADRLHQLGLHGPCLVLGSPANNQELAYATGCANEPRTVPLVDDAAEDGSHIVWLGPLRPPRSYDLRWRPIDLPGRTPSTRFKIYLSAGTA